MMKRLLILGLILSLGDLFLLGQARFDPGFIITIDSDTVHGLIKSEGSVKHSIICQFKVDSNSDVQSFYPEDINGYKFREGKYYVSRNIDESESQAFFLEYLVDGVVDLYTLATTDGVRYFIQKEGGKLYSLENSVDHEVKDNKVFEVQKKEYIGYLKYLFADAPEVMKKTESVKLERKDLIRISSNYHQQVCDEYECVVYQKEIPGRKIAIGPLLGFHRFKINPNEHSYHLGNRYLHFPLEYEIQHFQSFGLCVVYPFRFSPRMSLRYELRYFSQDLQSEYFTRDYYDDSILNRYTFSIKTSTLSHTLYLNYRWMDGKFSPITSLGVTYTHPLEFERIGMDQWYFLDDDFQNYQPIGAEIGVGLSVKYFRNNELNIMATYRKSGGVYTYYGADELILSIGLPFCISGCGE